MRKMLTTWVCLLSSSMVLAGCFFPVPEQRQRVIVRRAAPPAVPPQATVAPVTVRPVTVGPVTVRPVAAPVDATPGFNEREPDTCKAAGLQHLVGQPAGMIRTVPVGGPVRIIGPGELVSQEYSAARVDVETDAAGIITRISCG